MPTGRKPKLSLVVGERLHSSHEEQDARAENQPTGCDAKFDPPEELSKGALKEWVRVVALYSQLDSEVLNDLDQGVFVAYCETVAVFKEAQREYQKLPLFGRDKESQQRIENPYVRIMDRAGQSIAKYAEQLCLSPVGRARMGIAKSKAGGETPLEKAGFSDV